MKDNLHFQNLKQAYQNALVKQKPPFMKIMQGTQAPPSQPRTLREPPKETLRPITLLWPRL